MNWDESKARIQRDSDENGERLHDRSPSAGAAVRHEVAVVRVIADKDLYSIRIDEHKNRLHLDLRGFWSDAHEVSGYIDDLVAAMAYLTPGFTIVTHAAELHPAPLDVIAVHVKAQKLLMDAGLARTAEILPKEAVARISAQRFSRESGMIHATFPSREEAEAWLDS